MLGLAKYFQVAPPDEKWIGGIVGVLTGLVSAATGVQVMPSMPYMQAIGMEKDELVQALGVFFTVATVALAFNLTSAGLLTAATALPGAVAMVAPSPACSSARRCARGWNRKPSAAGS